MGYCIFHLFGSVIASIWIPILVHSFCRLSRAGLSHRIQYVEHLDSPLSFHRISSHNWIVFYHLPSFHDLQICGLIMMFKESSHNLIRDLVWGKQQCTSWWKWNVHSAFILKHISNEDSSDFSHGRCCSCFIPSLLLFLGIIPFFCLLVLSSFTHSLTQAGLFISIWRLASSVP